MVLFSSPVSHILGSLDMMSSATLYNDAARDNYRNWRACMKSYLLSQDLWDVIEASSEPKPEDSETDSKTWRKKNAATLLAIQNSCMADILSEIREIASAKDAWDMLAKKYELEPPKVNSGQPDMVKDLQATSNNPDMLKDLNKGHSSLSKTNLGDPATQPQLPAIEEVDKGDEGEESDESEAGEESDESDESEEGEESDESEESEESDKGEEGDLAIQPQLPAIEEVDKGDEGEESDESEEGEESDESDGSEESDEGIQDIDYSQFKLLRKAINKGYLGIVKHILVAMPDAINEKITSDGQTALHVAIIAGHLKIVENLLEEMSQEDLEIQDANGNTALATAAIYGRIKIAECIIGKNETLVTVGEQHRLIPLTLACLYGHKYLTWYLYSVTPLAFLLSEDGVYGSQALVIFINSNMFDLALDMITRYPQLTTIRDHFGNTPMSELSCNHTAFLSGCRLVFWQQWIYSCIYIQPPIVSSDIRVNIPQETQNDQKNNTVQGLCQFRELVLILLKLFGIEKIYDMKLKHTYALKVLHCMSEEISTLNVYKSGVRYSIFEAAKHGIVEFIIEMIKANNDLMTVYNNSRRYIFQFAVEHRQEKIFSLIYGIGVRNYEFLHKLSSNRNNVLLLAGMLAPSSQLDSISGAALQMQRERQWYKEVESIMIPSFREHRNSDNETPRQVFTRNHKDLLKAGEKWMKETATSCTVVAALIITVMFAAAFTVPGGNDQNTGFPIFLHEKWFMVFIISDAISLFASSTSVLMFLGILTSRYREDDFLKSLPTKLIIGLFTLFVSIAAMMVAFSAALLLMLKGRLEIVIPIVLLAGVPITLFVMLQFPLLVEIFMSTYGPSIFDRKMKPWF